MKATYLGKSIFDFSTFVLEKIDTDQMRRDGHYGCPLDDWQDESYRVEDDIEMPDPYAGKCCVLGWASIYFEVAPWTIDTDNACDVTDANDEGRYKDALEILVNRITEGE